MGVYPAAEPFVFHQLVVDDLLHQPLQSRFLCLELSRLDLIGQPHTQRRPLRTVPLSPIDNFYSYLSSLVPLGTEEQLKNSDAFGRGLMLGIVSAT